MNTAFIYMNSSKGAVGRGAGYVYASINGNKQFYNTRYVKLEDLPGLIAKGSFDIMMISAMTLLFSKARQLIRSVKASTRVPVVVGGVHPTVVGPSLLEKCPEIDYLCMGEGESFVNDFLDNYGKGSLYGVDNLVYRKDGMIHVNPVRPPEDLTRLPSFPWNLFPQIADGQGYLYVTAVRGCPYTCTYCCNIAYLKLYKQSYIRSRPIDQVVEELDYLKRNYKFNMFYFGDDMIFSNREYAEELFLAVGKIGKPYGCMGRVESIDKKMADHLYDTGCKYVAMGIECGDENFRKKYLNRFMTNDQIRTAFKLLHKRDIKTTSFNMVGWPFPGEAERTRATIALNREIKPGSVQVTWFYPFPGTKLYEHCVKNDLIDPNASARSYHKKSVLKTYVGKSKPFKSRFDLKLKVL